MNHHLLNWNAKNPKAGRYIFRTREEMAEIWMSHGGKPEEMPVVDFEKHSIVAMFLDAGSYHSAPGIQSIQPKGDIIEVHYRISSTPWKMINPCSVILTSRIESDVIFVEDPQAS